MQSEISPAEAPIFRSYAEAVKSGCAAACNLSRVGADARIPTFRERIAADIALLFRGLLVAYIVICGLFLGRWIAELLRAA